MKEEKNKIPLWVLWLLQKRKIFFMALAALVSLLVTGYLGFNFFEEKAKSKVAVNETIFHKWAKEPKLDDEYQKLKDLMNKDIAFKQKYEGALADVLIQAGFTKEGYYYLEKSLEKAQESLLPFAKFSMISALVAESEYEKALKESYQLKETLAKDPFFSQNEGSALIAINHLRISMLEEALKNKEKSQEALKDLEKYLRTEKTPSFATKGAKKLLELLNADSSVGLKQYIAYKKSTLR